MMARPAEVGLQTRKRKGYAMPRNDWPKRPLRIAEGDVCRPDPGRPDQPNFQGTGPEDPDKLSRVVDDG